MRIGIITRKLSPEICGIGDHTLFFAKALESQGHEVVITAGRGEPSGKRIVTGDVWNAAALARLLEEFKKLSLEHLILQYTPLSFAEGKGWSNRVFCKFWQACWQVWKTSLIIHETYFRVWEYPPSWWRGTAQKYYLRELASASDFVFTASAPLVEELNTWSLGSKTNRLPIGSNFPYIPIDKTKFRNENRISSETIILLLFGGGAALRGMTSYVNALDAYLRRHRVTAAWLLLGGTPAGWFKLNLPILSPGRLSPENVSAWLQTADIFLMPHKPGLNAKRGTLAAALQHGLPVVGTRGPMTDSFWNDVSGVNLVQAGARLQFCDKVKQLCMDKNLRHLQGEANQRYYQNHLTWTRIAHDFLKGVFSQCG